jgi:Glycosyl hydrolases family 25
MGSPGVDVASFQGAPGAWTGVAGDIGWAAVKFTELQPTSSYTSQDAAADWSWLKGAGKGRVAYLFGHPATSPVATVGLFAAACERYGLDDGDGICLDHEVADGLGPAAAAGWAAEVLGLLEQRLGRRPLLYTFLSFAWEGYCTGLGGWPLWIADPSATAGHPRVPAPWTSWAIHQYVITGPIDRDLAAWDDLAGMRRTVGVPEQPVPPKPPRRPEEHMKDLGGSFTVSTPAACRWEDGTIVLAATDAAGNVLTRRWNGKAWSAWTAASPSLARSGPALQAWAGKAGRLYFVAASNGHLIELTTGDGGVTWQ